MATESSQTFHWQDDELDDHDFQIRGSTLLYIAILFSILIIISVCYFLYDRCINARSSRSSPPPSQPQGLDSATINNLPITIHHQQSSSAESIETTSECSICLGVFGEGEKVKVLPICCHCYHSECVDKWLIKNASCPICRTSLRVDSPV